MFIPENAKEAADYIAYLANKAGLPLSIYCESRGVSPSVLSRWKHDYKGYNVTTFLRLVKE